MVTIANNVQYQLRKGIHQFANYHVYICRFIFCRNFPRPAILIKNKFSILPQKVRSTPTLYSTHCRKTLGPLWTLVKMVPVRPRLQEPNFYIYRFGEQNCVHLRNIANSRGFTLLDVNLTAGHKSRKLATIKSKHILPQNSSILAAYGCAWSHRSSQLVLCIPLHNWYCRLTILTAFTMVTTATNLQYKLRLC